MVKVEHGCAPKAAHAETKQRRSLYWKNARMLDGHDGAGSDMSPSYLLAAGLLLV
jgi:hypothetical protein